MKRRIEASVNAKTWSSVAIISRVILAMFWFAIQTVNGGDVVQVMITAIWPSFARVHNTIPTSQGITTAQMVSFFICESPLWTTNPRRDTNLFLLIVWLIQIPFLYMHPNNLRYLFITKSILVPICFIAILIWSFRSTGGTGGPLLGSSAKASITGSAYSYAWLSSLTSVIGNYATLSVNMPDFSRYSKASVQWQWLYVPMLPIVFTFISFIGIAATSAGQQHYGQLDWNPATLISNWPNRSCQFFAGFAFCLAALGVNISANSLSAANDLAALFPSYINIRRGQLICALVAWVMVPWKILATASGFLNFMSAYSVFLGPIAAILVWDFWWVHDMKYDIVALYHPERYSSSSTLVLMVVSADCRLVSTATPTASIFGPLSHSSLVWRLICRASSTVSIRRLMWAWESAHIPLPGSWALSLRVWYTYFFRQSGKPRRHWYQGRSYPMKFMKAKRGQR